MGDRDRAHTRAQRLALLWLLAAAAACDGITSPQGRSGPRSRGDGEAHTGHHRTLRLRPVGVAPLAVRVRIGDSETRVGPGRAWRLELPPGRRRVLVDAVDPWDPYGWYALDLVLDDADPSLVLPLLPRRPALRPYGEQLDLLYELVEPWSRDTIAHWERDTLRVAALGPHVDELYRRALREAAAVWNERLGRPHLLLDARAESVQVEVTVHEEPALAYTRVVARASNGAPTILRVHLSPRWAPETSRYVRRVLVHELAHVLGLWGHSVSLRHVVCGRAVIVDEPDSEEVELLRLLYQLPNGFALHAIDRTWRSPLPRGACPVDSANLDLPGQVELHRAVQGPDGRR